MPDEIFVPRRLDKFVRDSSTLTVAQARRALAAGRVVLRADGEDDAKCVPGAIVFEADVVMLDGARVVPRRDHHYAVLNKPSGVTSTTADPRRGRDLSEFLRKMPEGVFPVGRLDRETTGLLLFTTDGDLATSVLRPDHAIEKVYWLWLDDCVGEDDPRLRAFLEGIPLPTGVARASDVQVVARTDAFTELLVTLQTGMNRQIRRMCYAQRFHLVHLHRKRVGSLTLGDLPVGGVRSLLSHEVEALWHAVGGRDAVTRRRIAALDREAREARCRGEPLRRLESWLSWHREVVGTK